MEIWRYFETINNGPLSDEKLRRINSAMDSLKPRSKTLKEMADQATYLMAERPLSITGKRAKPFKNDVTLDYLRTLNSRLNVLQDMQWTEDAVQDILTTFAEEHGIGFGKIGQPVRAALTAGAPSPDLSLVISLLGKTETIGRIEDVMSGASLKQE